MAALLNRSCAKTWPGFSTAFHFAVAQRRTTPGRVLLVFLLALSPMLPARARAEGATSTSPASSVLVYRTFMPEAGPSSFAVGLGANIGFCYDPGRGGINYIWRGEFADLGPTWKAKINNPADLRGDIVHREWVRWPLRLNRPEREPNYEFKGYALLPDAVEFHYLLDGILVREEIRVAPEGDGLIRRFRLSEPCESWWLLADAAAASALSSAEGNWDQHQGALAGRGGREFSIRVKLRGAQP